MSLPNKKQREALLKIAKEQKIRKDKIDAEELHAKTLKENKELKKRELEIYNIYKKKIEDEVLYAIKKAEKTTFISIAKHYSGWDVEDNILKKLINYCKRQGYEAYKGSESYTECVNYDMGTYQDVSYDVLRIKW